MILTLRELKTLVRLVVQEELDESAMELEREQDELDDARFDAGLEAISKHAIPLSEMWEKLVRKFPSC